MELQGQMSSHEQNCDFSKIYAANKPYPRYRRLGNLFVCFWTPGNAPAGTGVNGDTRPLPSEVIPAKAGIHSASH